MIRRKQQDTAKGHSKKEWRDTGEKNQTDIQRKGVAGMDEEMVLCAASAYERKFYLNPEFNSSAEFLEDPHTNLVFSFIKKLKDGLAVLLQNLYSLQNLRQYKKQKKYAMI